MLKEEVLAIIKKYSFYPNLELDQFFLVNDDVLLEILKRFKRKDVVLQIGLGLGTITHRLAARVKRLFVIEIDKKLIEIFKKEYSKKFMRIKIIREDALKVGWPEFNKFFSSLPFTIADAIIRKLEKRDFEEAIMIMPKNLFEKANSLYNLKFEKLMELEPTDFYPNPGVPAVLARCFKI